MSQLIETLAKIDQAGGTIVVRDQEVRLRVRPGTLTDQDREILAKHREDILTMLASGDGDETQENTGKTAIVSPSAAETDRKTAIVSPVKTDRKRSRVGRRPLTWPIEGADEVLALTPADLPPTPWRSGSLRCFDNGKLLNELRIDLTVIGRNGVNYRSGRLRRDVAVVATLAKLQQRNNNR